MTTRELSLMSVLVIEDNEEARNNLVGVLQIYFNKVYSAIDGCDGLDKVKNLLPDILICDIKMPCLNGIDLIKKVKKDIYKPIVILTTAFSDEEYLLEALDIKVDAYLIKPIRIDTLINKIKDSFNDFSSDDKRYKRLSVREFEVFIDLARGLRPIEIALKYNIKAKTVSTYRSRIFEKLLFKTNAELISYAIKNNLI